MVAKAFNETFAVCAANSSSMSKLLTFLASPLRAVITTFLTFAIGIGLFTLHSMYELVLTRCSKYFISLFTSLNQFYSKIMRNVPHRFFDLSLQEALAQIQPRNSTNLSQLSGPNMDAHAPFLLNGGRTIQACFNSLRTNSMWII